MHVKKEKGERNPYQGEATRSKRARNTLAAAQATSIREKARTMTLEKLVYLPKPLRDADPDLGVTVNAIPNSNWYGTLHIADCDVVLVNSLTSLDDCVNGIYLHYVVGAWMFGKRLVTLQWLRERSKTSSLKFTAPWKSGVRKKELGWFFTEELHAEPGSKPWIVWMRIIFATPDSKWSELTTPAQLAAWRAASKPLTEVSNLQQLHRMLKSMRIIDKRNSNLDFC